MKFLAAICFLLFLGSDGLAQSEMADRTSTNATVGDIKLIRQILEQQSRQIEALTQQVETLVRIVQENQGTIPGIDVGTVPMDSMQIPPGVAEDPIPVLPATPARRTHVVIKGESLSSIADLYGISVTELMKLNPMQDPRKMQIGQTLLLPIEETPADNPSPVAPQPTPPPLEQ